MGACHHLCLEMHIAEKTFVEQNVITDSISNIWRLIYVYIYGCTKSELAYDWWIKNQINCMKTVSFLSL